MKNRLFSEDHTFKLDNFEGPLDLLLELIRNKKVDIFEINLLTLIDQYCDYVEANSTSHVENITDYLVMAAYLLEIKSKLLLPKPVKNLEEFELNEKTKLIASLKEYYRFKQLANIFKTKLDQRQLQFDKSPMNLDKLKKLTPPKIKGVSPEKLKFALSQMIERISWEKPVEKKLVQAEFSQEKIKQIMDDYIAKLEPGKQIDLFCIIEETYPGGNPHLFLIYIFTTILELVKEQKIILLEQNKQTSIKILKREN